MQRKIRELVKELKKAGFVNRGGKRGHRNFKHKDGAILIISGKLGADAKPYQVKNC
jgi:predicted RNA binding protein YcfA (HicA-like mRNA interferase family)